jgi:hypothetical protein
LIDWGIMTQVKIVEIDGQTAVLLPPEVAAHLNARPGGVLSLVPSPGGGAWLVTNEEVAKQISYAHGLMREFPKTFEALAK